MGTGTLFFYAKTKAELLLLVHNVKFAEAIDGGVTVAGATPDILDAIMAIVQPIVACNRVQIENGRAYLRELVFGDPDEYHHKVGLELTGRVDDAIAGILRRDDGRNEHDAAQLARIISAIMFINMTATVFTTLSDDSVVGNIRDQVRTLLGARRAGV